MTADLDIERWRGRVALVTGASSGIGREITRKLARSGMKLAICARRRDRLDDLAAELDADVLVHPCDMRDEDQILGLFEAIRERWGGVDVLVNNAGLGLAAPLMSGATERWRNMLDVNVLALCICTREAIADMRKRGDDGHVIHISSMAAHRVPRGSGVYSATKYAVRSLTEGLRQELREAQSKIRITAISPGYVETEFAAVYHGDEAAARETYSQFEVLQSDDIAEAVGFVLATPPHMQVHDMLIRPRDQKS